MRDLRGSRVRITAWESRQAYGTVNVPQDLDLFRDDAEVIQSTQLSRVLIEIDDPAPMVVTWQPAQVPALTSRSRPEKSSVWLLDDLHPPAVAESPCLSWKWNSL
jgi:hypothetical protein